ncbi:MAG TPA: cupredoxin domain-containing protein [Rhizomicrobium sp.]|nr:cupredoxin domain-containing protein [Rhizomicrobium sp.]
MNRILPLAAALALASLSANAQTPEAVSISMTSYAFTPSTITLKAGRTYRIHFANAAGKGHDFSAPEFFAASAVAPEDRSKLEDGKEVELEGGQSADITLTPNRAGTFSVTCTHFLHATFGMKGQIVVQ